MADLLKRETGPQVEALPANDGKLSKYGEYVSLSELRRLRRHDIIRLCRAIIIAPLLKAEWSVESDEGVSEDIVSFIDSEVASFWESLLDSGLKGVLDFGYQCYEKVFENINGTLHLKYLVPLLPEYCTVYVETETGKLAFLRVKAGTREVDLEVDKVLILNAEVEGTNWYGESILQSAYPAFKMQEEYDELTYNGLLKSTYGTPLIQVPPGQQAIGEQIANDLRLGNSIVVQRTVDDQRPRADDNHPEYTIDIISFPAKDYGSLLNEKRYCDERMVRALMLPPRAVLEGTHGTKSEAEVHTDTAIAVMEARLRLVVTQINKHVINQLLRENYGDSYENKVWISLQPIADKSIEYLKQILSQILSLSPEVASMINLTSIMEKLAIPVEGDSDNENFVDTIRAMMVQDNADAEGTGLPVDSTESTVEPSKERVTENTVSLVDAGGDQIDQAIATGEVDRQSISLTGIQIENAESLADAYLLGQRPYEYVIQALVTYLSISEERAKALIAHLVGFKPTQINSEEKSQ